MVSSAASFPGPVVVVPRSPESVQRRSQLSPGDSNLKTFGLRLGGESVA